jgi:murein DD-endopeptidase MepM/ murein hydrolase activator NlpD
LIIRRDENLEERFSLVLTPLNLVILACVGLFVFGTLVFVLLAYTPLNHLFPSSGLKYSNEQQYEMLHRIDSLETAIKQIKLKSSVLDKILAGDELTVAEAATTEAVVIASVDDRPEPIDPPVIRAASSPSNAGGSNRPLEAQPILYSFFRPLKGVVSDGFNQERKHTGIDIAAPAKSVIKSVQDGTVVFSDWTPGGGHTLIIQHPNQFISVYKHNAVLLKKEGTFVKAGDAISLVGSSGEHSTGPHLHFELWHKGVPVNPTKYINF